MKRMHNWLNEKEATCVNKEDVLSDTDERSLSDCENQKSVSIDYIIVWGNVRDKSEKNLKSECWYAY